MPKKKPVGWCWNCGGPIYDEVIKGPKEKDFCCFKCVDIYNRRNTNRVNVKSQANVSSAKRKKGCCGGG